MKRAYLEAIKIGEDGAKIPIGLYQPKWPRGKWKARHHRSIGRYNQRVHQKIADYHGAHLKGEV